MVTPTQLVDDETKAGKKFIRNVENLKTELGIKPVTKDITKQVKKLTQEQIKNNVFLTSFLNKYSNDLFKNLELKNVTIGTFGRKSGYVNYPIEENYFRFVIHLGSPEIYYIDSNQVRNKQLPMLNGYGFLISPQESANTYFTVYSNTLRIIDDEKVRPIISKIRPKNYSRTVLVYDFAFNIPEEEIE